MFFDFYSNLSYTARMSNRIFSLFWSTKVAIVLLVLIILSCVVGVSMPSDVGKDFVFYSLWFNLLLVLLIVNIVFCIVKRTNVLRLSQAGSTIFHLGLVALFVGVVYDQLFFFEGEIRLTEGESLVCADPASWDVLKYGRFFRNQTLNELGQLYFHKLHIAYQEEGKFREEAIEISVGTDVQRGSRRIVYIARPLKYKGFELYREKRDGYSPLVVLRDKQGKVLLGSFVALQSIRQQDGTFLYRSGTALEPGSFKFPQDPAIPPLYNIQTIYYPDKAQKGTGDISFKVWKYITDDKDASEELVNVKAAFGERIKAGDYFLSLEEVRYWTSIYVTYRPGLTLIFSSFWIALGGLILNLSLKTAKSREKESMAA